MQKKCNMHTLLKHVKNATRSEICSNRIKLTCLDRLDRQTDTVTLHRDPAKDYTVSTNSQKFKYRLILLCIKMCGLQVKLVTC